MRRPPLLRSLFALSLFLCSKTALALPLPDDQLVEQGSARLEAGDADAAILLFREAEKRAPKDPRPHFLRGAALAKKKDGPGAISAYRAALALDGKLAAVHNELGALLQESGKIDEAASEYQKAIAANPQLGEAFYNLGKIQSQKEDHAAAITSLKSAAQLLPKDADVRIDLSVAYRKANRNEDAVRAAREAVALDGASEATHLNLGFALQAAGKEGDAEGEFKTALRLDPKSATAYWALGKIEGGRKHPGPAIVALQHAYDLKPSPSILSDLVHAYFDAGQGAKAEQLVRAKIEQSPRSMALRLLLAKTLGAQNRCAEAKRSLLGLPKVKEVTDLEVHIDKECTAPPTKK